MGGNTEINLKDLIQTLLKRAWIIILCAVLGAAVSLVYTVKFVTPTYKAGVTMYVNNNTTISGMTSSDLAVALQLANTYVNIIKSDAVLDKVIDETGLNLSASQIRGMLSAEVVDETEMFQVNIISPDPQMSADIVNAIAAIAPDEISRIIEGSSAKVIDYAKVPANRYAPSYTSNTILGGFAGAAVVIAVILILKFTDGRVQTEDDLLAISKIPVLGTIPDFAETARQQEKAAQKKERQGAK